jgi:hypothetical protein
MKRYQVKTYSPAGELLCWYTTPSHAEAMRYYASVIKVLQCKVKVTIDVTA